MYRTSYGLEKPVFRLRNRDNTIILTVQLANILATRRTDVRTISILPYQVSSRALYRFCKMVFAA